MKALSYQMWLTFSMTKTVMIEKSSHYTAV